jgi:hypothetical protein
MSLARKLGLAAVGALLAIAVSASAALAIPVRGFGTSDHVKVRVNPENNITGAITMVALVRSTGTESQYYISLLNSEGVPAGYKFVQTTGHKLELTNSEGSAIDSVALTQSEWQLIAVTKPAGKEKPRFHVYGYSTKKWAHRTASGSMPNGASVSEGRIRFGGNGSMEYAAAALYPRALSDKELESMTSSYSEWLGHEPSGMWIFNQPDLTKPLLDETGGGANEVFAFGETFGTEVASSSTPPNEDPNGTVFRGDFYRGKNLEWSEIQKVGSTASFSINELSPPLPSEDHFTRSTLSYGDERAEAAAGLHMFAGEDDYYQFYARLGKSFPVEAAKFSLIWQLHQSGIESSPPLAMYIRPNGGKGRYSLEDTKSTVWWEGPEIDAETWHKFVIRVNGSTSSKTGFAEVWMDGVQQKMANGLNRYNGATMLDEYNYPKMGYYRDNEIKGTGTVDIAGYRIAKNLSDLP